MKGGSTPVFNAVSLSLTIGSSLLELIGIVGERDQRAQS
jgi:hypothetical protein